MPADDNAPGLERIVIVGPWGAGKSTLAGRLGELLQRDVIYLDTLFWKPDWTATRPEEQQSIVTDLLTKQTWIIEGDHPLTQPQRFTAADTIFFWIIPGACVCDRPWSAPCAIGASSDRADRKVVGNIFTFVSSNGSGAIPLAAVPIC